MNFPSMNAIRASRASTGLGAGGRPAPQPMPMMGGSMAMGHPQMGPVAPARSAAPTPQPQYAGSGSLNVSGGAPPPAYSRFGNDTVNPNDSAMMNIVGHNDSQGVARPGSQLPPMQGPAPVNFDPNDPNNAALAGYMSGGGTGMMGT